MHLKQIILKVKPTFISPSVYAANTIIYTVIAKRKKRKEKKCNKRVAH